MAKPVLIGDFLHRIRRPVDLDPVSLYKLVTVKLKHKGVVLRGEKLGADIKSKMYLVKEGDFILSGIDARNGAFGIVPPELDGAVVTNDFWYFEIDDNVVDKGFFLELTSTHWFDEICRKGSDGTTQRIRLQKSKFFNQTIYLPDLAEQRIFNKQFQAIKTRKKILSSELAYQQALLKKLRQQILQEAIEGKLTADWRAQNPGVEPASELLKRITAEKTQLVEDKKIKAQKPLPPITEQEKLYELPQGWDWCRLGDLILMQYGKALTKAQTKPSGKYPVYGSNGIVGYHSKGLTDKRSVIVGRKGSAGALQISELGSWTTDVAYFVEESKFLSFNYLICLLRSLRLGELGKGIKPGLNRSEAYLLMVPLATFPEQQAIVTKVEKLLSICDQLESHITQNQTHAEQLMQAVLKKAFSHNREAELTDPDRKINAHAPEAAGA